MRTDRNGCSTCPVGAEQYEEFPFMQWGVASTSQETRVQYDYRDHDGKLFSCVSPTLEICRARRDEWKAKKDGLIPA